MLASEGDGGTPVSKKGTIIYSSATAAFRAGPTTAQFACGKFALRALSQSVAKEYGKQGIHACHARLDGILDIPKTRAAMPEMFVVPRPRRRLFAWRYSAACGPLCGAAKGRRPRAWRCPCCCGSRQPRHSLSPRPFRYEAQKMASTDEIANIYFSLSQQSPMAWSNEVDIRPFQEGWTC